MLKWMPAVATGMFVYWIGTGVGDTTSGQITQAKTEGEVKLYLALITCLWLWTIAVMLMKGAGPGYWLAFAGASLVTLMAAERALGTVSVHNTNEMVLAPILLLAIQLVVYGIDGKPAVQNGAASQRGRDGGGR